MLWLYIANIGGLTVTVTQIDLDDEALAEVMRVARVTPRRKP